MSPPAATMPAPFGLFMSTEQAAAVIGVSARTIRNMIVTGNEEEGLHAFCPARRKLLLYTDEVLAYARSRQASSAAAARANIARLRALVSGK